MRGASGGSLAPRSDLYLIYAALADAFHWQHEMAKLAEEGWIDFAVGVQRSLEAPLQDAISGPSVILSFKSQFGFLIAFAAV